MQQVDRFIRAELVIAWLGKATISELVLRGLSKADYQATTFYKVYFKDRVQESGPFYMSIMFYLRTAVRIHYAHVEQDGNWLELWERNF